MHDFKRLSDSDAVSEFKVVNVNGVDYTSVRYSLSNQIRISYFSKVSNELKAGNSYTLTYTVANNSVSGYVSGFLYLTDDPENFDNSVELGSFTTENLTGKQDYSIQITYPDNFNGKQCYLVVMLIVVPSKVNNNFVSSSPGFLISDFVFTNNNQSEEKIDSILDLVSAIYHGIVGGEDSRGVVHDGLVQGIKNGLNSLGDRISNFFDNLGEKFGIDIGSLGDRIRDFFSNFWENVSAGFDAIKDKIGDIGEGIKAKFQEIADSFTAFFDTFKPRVYEEFLWTQGKVNWTGSIGPNGSNDQTAITSEVFTISSADIKYCLDFISKTSNNIAVVSLEILRVNESGYTVYEQYPLITKSGTYSLSEGTYTLTEGYYKFVLTTKANGSNNVNKMDAYTLSKYCNSKVKVYCDEGWINAFINAIMNGLKKLFIPAPGYFESKLDVFLETYEDHFGIFAQVTTYFIKAIQKVESILSDKYSFEFPELYITIQGQKYVFSEHHTVDLQQWLNSGTWSSELYEMYRVCASAILVFYVLKYARKVEGVILGNADFIFDLGS